MPPDIPLIDGAWDPRSGTLNVGPETRDPAQRWDAGPEKWDLRPKTRDPESRFSENFLSFL